MSPVDPTLQQTFTENVWLHFFQMGHSSSTSARPTILVRGEGSRVWDQDGNAYIDALAGLFCVNAGYGRREIVEAVAAQMLDISFVSPFSFPNLPQIKLAGELAKISPMGRQTRSFFVTGGSEAVETALKLAKAYQRKRGFGDRHKTISRRVAYHGTTMGALSVNGLTGARSHFGPLVPGARHAPMSHRYRCPYCKDAPACNLTCYDEIERLDQVVAIITEPVQNAGGCIPPGSLDYFKKIRKLCDETGILMIMDEVICGFGRLGELFGSTYFGVEPDVITLAKGITSSYAPLGAVMVRKSVADTFVGEGPGFSHGLTFGGHPVSCAAALANLDIFLEEDLAGQAKATGAYLRSELESAFADHPNVGDIRGAGLFLGVELVADRATKQTLPQGSDQLHWLTDEMRASGLILRNDDRGDPTTQLSPPLVITREECD